MLLIPLFVIAVISWSFYKFLSEFLNQHQAIFGVFYMFLLFLFLCGLGNHSAPYNMIIDPNHSCYTPFADEHWITMVVYFILCHSALLLVIKYRIKMPPLVLTGCLATMVIGVFICITIILQVSVHHIDSFKMNLEYSKKGSDSGGLLFFPASLCYIVLAIFVIVQTVREQADKQSEIVYRNDVLNYLNYLLAIGKLQPIWIILFVIPILLIITIVLVLWGQDPYSLKKVFTETTTWRLSQKSHPPVITKEHHGHYLCTVAACGSPALVQPVRLGKRHGKTIIVNRQLMIANAFEELLNRASPKLHYFIRTNYDRYGYNLSKKINSTFMSNLTYILMKPLEFLFLFVIYTCSLHPEELIKKQYKA